MTTSYADPYDPRNKSLQEQQCWTQDARESYERNEKILSAAQQAMKQDQNSYPPDGGLKDDGMWRQSTIDRRKNNDGAER